MRPLRRLNLPLAALVTVAAAALAVLASRVRDWVVMTDELQYSKLATAIADGSLLPTLRGERVEAYSQLYPLLLSPLYGTLGAPDALTAVHVLNALLYASAAVPVYLLTREVGLSSRWGLCVAALALLAPWSTLTGFVMTEAAAFAVCCWAFLAFQRALDRPSTTADALALVALAAAVFVRTQFVVLGLVLPLAVVLVDGRRALRRHRVLAGAYALGAVLALVLLATGGVARVLGRYEVTATEGSLLPLEAIVHAGAHLDIVGLGIGLVGMLLGGAWLVSRRTTFSTLALVTVVTLTLVSSSYDARFGGGLTDVRDRYLFYVAPLLLVAFALALREGVPRVALGAVTAFFAITIFAYEFFEVPGFYVDSPVAVVAGWAEYSGGALFVALLAVVLALSLVIVPLSRRTLTVGAVGFVAVWCAAMSTTAWARLLTGDGPSGRPIAAGPPTVPDWIDRVLPEGADVALLTYPVTPGEWGINAVQWWDTEFWNRSVNEAFVLDRDESWDHAPFPHDRLEIDRATGAVSSTGGEPEYVVTAGSDARLRLAGAEVANNLGLYVIRAERPYRAEWATWGLDSDGYTLAARSAEIRVFPAPGAGPERVTVDVRLAAPPNEPVVARLAGDQFALDPGESRSEQLGVCVAPPRGAQVSLDVVRSARIPPPPYGPGYALPDRDVGPRVASIAVFRSSEAC